MYTINKQYLILQHRIFNAGRKVFFHKEMAQKYPPGLKCNIEIFNQLETTNYLYLVSSICCPIWYH